MTFGARGSFGDSGWKYVAAANRSDYKSDQGVFRFLRGVDDYFLGPQTGTHDYEGDTFPSYDADPSRLTTPLDARLFRSLSTHTLERDKAWTEDLSFSVNGELLQLPAGPLGVAGVIEAGRQGFSNRPDPRINAGEIWNVAEAHNDSGTRNRYAAGIELNVPIFAQPHRHRRGALRPLQVFGPEHRQEHLQPRLGVPPVRDAAAARHLLDLVPRAGHELPVRQGNGRLRAGQHRLLPVRARRPQLQQLRRAVQHELPQLRQPRPEAGERQVVHLRPGVVAAGRTGPDRRLLPHPHQGRGDQSRLGDHPAHRGGLPRRPHRGRYAGGHRFAAVPRRARARGAQFARRAGQSESGDQPAAQSDQRGDRAHLRHRPRRQLPLDDRPLRQVPAARRLHARAQPRLPAVRRRSDARLRQRRDLPAGLAQEGQCGPELEPGRLERDAERYALRRRAAQRRRGAAQAVHAGQRQRRLRLQRTRAPVADRQQPAQFAAGGQERGLAEATAAPGTTSTDASGGCSSTTTSAAASADEGVRCGAHPRAAPARTDARRHRPFIGLFKSKRSAGALRLAAPANAMEESGRLSSGSQGRASCRGLQETDAAGCAAFPASSIDARDATADPCAAAFREPPDGGISP